MADANRPNKRERRDEAKKRRLEEMRRRQRRQRMRKVYGIVAVVVVVGGATAGILAAKAASGKKDKEFNAAAVAAGCENLQNPRVIQGTHIQPPQRASGYSSNPPTSGEHYNAAGLGPLATGIHDQPVQNEGYVHNLEHGHIVIFYKASLDASLLEALKNVVRGDPQYSMIAPREDMPYVLAFTAWGHLEGCNAPNAQAAQLASTFIKRFEDQGPESGKPGVPQGV
jgi:hypothetical protein